MPGNCPVVGIISHCLKKYISIHLIAWRPIIPLHPGTLSSKAIHDPFISLLWNLWSLMLLMLCAILKATQQHLTLMLRKYSAWVEWTPPVWSFTSCICEIRKVSCSSPLSDRYFSRIPLKFDFPNLDRHRFAQHDLFASRIIWWSEHKKLNLLILTCLGILLKVWGWSATTPTLSLALLPTTHLLKSSIEKRRFELCPLVDLDVPHWLFWRLLWLYSLTENNKLLDDAIGSTEKNDILDQI